MRSRELKRQLVITTVGLMVIKEFDSKIGKCTVGTCDTRCVVDSDQSLDIAARLENRQEVILRSELLRKIIVLSTCTESRTKLLRVM